MVGFHSIYSPRLCCQKQNLPSNPSGKETLSAWNCLVSSVFVAGAICPSRVQAASWHALCNTCVLCDSTCIFRILVMLASLKIILSSELPLFFQVFNGILHAVRRQKSKLFFCNLWIQFSPYYHQEEASTPAGLLRYDPIYFPSQEQGLIGNSTFGKPNGNPEEVLTVSADSVFFFCSCVVLPFWLHIVLVSRHQEWKTTMIFNFFHLIWSVEFLLCFQ